MGKIITIPEASSYRRGEKPTRREAVSNASQRQKAQRREKELRLAEREEKVAVSATTQYIHGPGGLLVTPGVDPTLINLIQRPRGLASRLAFRPSTDMVPLYEAITGLASGTGAEPQTECDLPPESGTLKAGTLTAPFGKMIRKTQNLVLNRLGQYVNRAEPKDLTIANSATENSPFIPDPARNANFANSSLAMQYYMLGLRFETDLEPLVFTGLGTNMTGTGYKEFWGLETLVNTGKVDALTNAANAALDSTVISWGSALVNSTQAFQGKSITMVDLLSNLLKFKEAEAQDMGIGPVSYAIVMHRDLFWEITSFWPCQYNTNGCGLTAADVAAGAQMIVATGSEQTTMRDNLRATETLLVNGRRYPVVFTDSIPLVSNALGVKTDIYVLPASFMGMAGMYMEYFDFNNADISGFIGALPTGTYYTSNDGMYLWTFEKTAYCAYLEAMIMPRLVLRVPRLAARISNVVYRGILPTYNGYTTGLYPFPNAGFAAASYGTSNFYIYPNSV